MNRVHRELDWIPAEVANTRPTLWMTAPMWSQSLVWLLDQRDGRLA